MEFLIFAIVASIVSVWGTYSAWKHFKRTGDISNIAARAGLLYSESDPFDCTRIWFSLFRKGDGRGAENVVWRKADDGHSYRAFDYWYYDEHRDENGQTQRNYHRFSCALALVGSSWPQIVVVREGLMAKVTNAVGGGDIDFESEEFNRMFSVWCEDRRFANALLDANMLEFLLSTKGELTFELKGRWLLIWRAPPIAAEFVPGMLGVVEEFVKRIPPVVWELYPSSFVDKDGKPLPAGDDPETRVREELENAAMDRRDDGDDPFAALARSPYEALERKDGVEFDLDGHQIPTVKEDPWGQGRN